MRFLVTLTEATARLLLADPDMPRPLTDEGIADALTRLGPTPGVVVTSAGVFDTQAETSGLARHAAAWLATQSTPQGTTALRYALAAQLPRDDKEAYRALTRVRAELPGHWAYSTKKSAFGKPAILWRLPTMASEPEADDESPLAPKVTKLFIHAATIDKLLSANHVYGPRMGYSTEELAERLHVEHDKYSVAEIVAALEHGQKRHLKHLTPSDPRIWRHLAHGENGVF